MFRIDVSGAVANITLTTGAAPVAPKLVAPPTGVNIISTPAPAAATLSPSRVWSQAGASAQTQNPSLAEAYPRQAAPPEQDPFTVLDVNPQGEVINSPGSAPQGVNDSVTSPKSAPPSELGSDSGGPSASGSVSGKSTAGTVRKGRVSQLALCIDADDAGAIEGAVEKLAYVLGLWDDEYSGVTVWTSNKEGQQGTSRTFFVWR